MTLGSPESSGHLLRLAKGMGRIFRDGNAWCATGPGFIDPVVSAFGCGDTPQEAYLRWCQRALADPTWEGVTIPRLDKFKIEK
jgi:hypothetical protein